MLTSSMMRFLSLLLLGLCVCVVFVWCLCGVSSSVVVLGLFVRLS